MEEVHRVFVGGLFDAVTKDELKNRFQTFGDVQDVTIVHKKDGEGNISKTFGYVNLMTTSQKLSRCFAVYGGTKWKGHELKVQLAKEDFITRLEKERNEPDVVKKKKKGNIGPTKTYTDILETTSTMRRIVPGTPVEGEKNWVIGKYGRPLPIVHISNVGRKKTVTVDPSKFCHCLRRIPDVDDDQVQVDKLTWSYDGSEMSIMKKRKEMKDIFSGNNETVECKQLTDTEESYGGMEIQPKKKKKKKDKEKDIGSQVLNGGETCETYSCDGEIEVHGVKGGLDTQSGKRKKRNRDNEIKENVENMSDIQLTKKKKKNIVNEERDDDIDHFESLEVNHNLDHVLLTGISDTSRETGVQSIKKQKKKKHVNNLEEKSIDKLLIDSSNSDTVDCAMSVKMEKKNEEETVLSTDTITQHHVDHDLGADESADDRSVNILNSNVKGKVEQCLEPSSSNTLEVSIPEILFEDTQVNQVRTTVIKNIKN